MKKIYQLVLVGCLLGCTNGVKNQDSQFATLPSLNLLLLDSVTKINTQNVANAKRTILMYVSPDCEHCHNMTTELLKNIHLFRDVQIYMLSPLALTDLKEFYNSFHLGDYKNIIVGRDYGFAFDKIFNAPTFPCTVIYNKDKKLVKMYRGEISIDKIVEATRI